MRGLLIHRSWSLQLDLNRPFRRADARPDHLPLLPIDLPVTEVTQPARAELADARMADAFPAPIRQVQAALLAGHQDRCLAVGFGFAVGLQELDRTALALARLAEAEFRLEALHVQLLAVAMPV